MKLPFKKALVRSFCGASAGTRRNARRSPAGSVLAAVASRDFKAASEPTGRLMRVPGPLKAVSEARRLGLGKIFDTLRARAAGRARMGDRRRVLRQTVWGGSAGLRLLVSCEPDFSLLTRIV
jgi:hypothetical protein